MLLKKAKQDIIATHQRAKNDTGSPEVQIALLTKSIEKLNEHLKNNKKDHHSRRGLLGQVNLRRKLLAYLSKKKPQAYQATLKALNLRK